jgi:hypothetical protein
MASITPEVDLSGIRDPQTPFTLAIGLVLIIVGIAGLTGLIDFNMSSTLFSEGLVAGLFGVPFWLGVTAIVAGLLGALLAFQGGSTTFNKVATGLVLPAVIFLSITDWALATGGAALVVGLVALLLAVVFAAVGTALLWGNWLAFVFPVVALLAILDWVLGITALLPSDPVTLWTVLLLVAVTAIVGIIGFEAGHRMTGNPE